MNKYNLDVTEGKFGEDGHVSQTGWLKVYLVNLETWEYSGPTMEYVTMGGGTSRGAYLDAPDIPTRQNIAIVRSEDGKKWNHVTDCRGKMAYHIENQQPIEIDFIGELPTDLTLLEPKTSFDKWGGNKWVTDTEAQKAALIAQAELEKIQILKEAEQQILMLERKVRLGMATDEEAEQLKQWEIYSVKVANINTSISPDIELLKNQHQNLLLDSRLR
ncbi:MAG: tail fiber assembly protein [Providencia heimbachae]|nr:tail fiber assembly protein [Providencia heimbachae]